MKSLLIYLCVFAGLLSACNVSSPGDSQTKAGPDGSPAQEGEFNYKTFNHVQVTVMLDFKSVEFFIYDQNEKKLATIKTNEGGFYQSKLSVPKTSTGLYFRSDYLGVPSEVFQEITDGSVFIDLRKPTEKFAVEHSLNSFESKVSFKTYQNISGFPDYEILGSWNYHGVPNYMHSRKNIEQEVIQKINEALPNWKPVPTYRPQYLTDTKDTDVHLLEDGDVYVTFLHEGAGYRNTLGFYTYQTADGPPTQVNDEDITIIFPNVSYRYSGGGLYSGDTVHIGHFPQGTSVGWVLMANAYARRYGAVGNGYWKFFSESALNPDEDPYKKHVVQIDLGYEDFFVLAFEDIKRPGGDKDFNDAVFTVSVTPNDAFDKTGLISDTDENVTDTHEDVDGEIALQDMPSCEVSGYQFFPGQDEFGTLAFEDLWPHKGDYDFNDMVIDYNVIETLDKNGLIRQVQVTLRVVGILASMNNGFGFQMGIEPEDVASVIGQKLTRGYAKVYANGVEKNQAKAVIIAFEEGKNHYNSADPDNSELITITVNFNRGVAREELGFAPYNPFIMSNGERGREVHLPGYQATDLVHLDYFGSYDDDSAVGTSYMYKTDGNLPWGIHLPEKFTYPHDSIRIYDAFNLFEAWVNSDGFSHSDWYTNKPGYKNTDLLSRQ